MFFLLGSDKKNRQREKKNNGLNIEEARDVFLSGKFPVVTTDQIEGRHIVKVLGLVCCRGFDSDETFFGMASRAMSKGAQAIIGYNENVAFHPDGSKYFSCYGTAVMFDYDPADPEALPMMLARAKNAQRSLDVSL
ncbi:MAG: YbjQ family protein [Desulfovibrio sp.]|nr:YbjQ family protein [Desulfovibrio sp.]